MQTCTTEHRLHLVFIPPHCAHLYNRHPGRNILGCVPDTVIIIRDIRIALAVLNKFLGMGGSSGAPPLPSQQDAIRHHLLNNAKIQVCTLFHPGYLKVCAEGQRACIHIANISIPPRALVKGNLCLY